jgi:aspartyl-tRNA(Asn)/glutamyl-tRNA(Gln) amidotransferase subunit C
MALTRADVEHIAELAKLRLTEDELNRYQIQLSAILEHIQELNQLDTDAISPTASVLPLNNVFAADVVRPPYTPAEILKNAPESEAGQFRVRAILED